MRSPPNTRGAGIARTPSGIARTSKTLAPSVSPYASSQPPSPRSDLSSNSDASNTHLSANSPSPRHAQQHGVIFMPSSTANSPLPQPVAPAAEPSPLNFLPPSAALLRIDSGASNSPGLVSRKLVMSMHDTQLDSPLHPPVPLKISVTEPNENLRVLDKSPQPSSAQTLSESSKPVSGLKKPYPLEKSTTFERELSSALRRASMDFGPAGFSAEPEPSSDEDTPSPMNQ